ncbi:MAG: DNA repair exonuclease [Bryobacterales bacterium]|nr:DNA repair exonuclease [Bryobacterales bacterium]
MHSFRFVHTADIHLDSPLRGLAGHDGTAVELIRGATREALVALVTRTIEEESSFLLIAGDLYDGDWRDYQTGLFFVGQMGRLREAGIPVFLIYGNHDAKSQITRHLHLPKNVVQLPSRSAGTHLIEKLGVAIHGQSFRRPKVTENVALRYPEPRAGHFNIGLLHTSLSGAEGHEHYAPCTIDHLVAKGYDYWALGHVHDPAIRHEFPHIVYPGVLQGRHIRETGPKGAMLVTVRDGTVAGVKPFQVDVVRWRVVDVPATDCHTIGDLENAMRRCIENEVSSQDDMRLLACRVRITGRSEAHGVALASQEHLLAEARAAAEGLGEERAWIERLVVATEPPTEAASFGALIETLGDVSAASVDEDLLAQLGDDIGTFVAKLDADLRRGPEDPLLRAAVHGEYGRLIELASPIALAELRRGGD